MRISRLLTVFEGGVSKGYVSKGSPPDPEADTSPGPRGRHPPGQADTCENITLPQTSFSGSNYCIIFCQINFQCRNPIAKR